MIPNLGWSNLYLYYLYPWIFRFIDFQNQNYLKVYGTGTVCFRQFFNDCPPLKKVIRDSSLRQKKTRCMHHYLAKKEKKDSDLQNKKLQINRVDKLRIHKTTATWSFPLRRQPAASWSRRGTAGRCGCRHRPDSPRDTRPGSRVARRPALVP